MEVYQGVKFKHHNRSQTFDFDQRLQTLDHWAFLFGQLGLAPIHSAGAYGNSSYRVKDQSFIITKSGMIPREVFDPDNYCHIIDVDTGTDTVTYDGKAPPSSECAMHHLLYQSQPGLQAILHGHCTLLNNHAEELDIPVTAKAYPYGTPELANSALEMFNLKTNFFILKDHGFVALADSIDDAGKLTLDYYMRLINLLSTR